MQGYLFDASSLIYAVKMKNIELLHDNCIQWLTVYEVVNALWKEVHLIRSLSVEDVHKLLKVILDVIEFMRVLSPHPYEPDIIATAHKLSLTAYDASYVVLAKKNDLVLVTEDWKLRKKAQAIINVASINEIIA